MNNKIKEILAYMEEYVKITDMHDSEPMLNWKDLEIVLEYIKNLQQRIDKAIEYIEENDFTNDMNFMETGIGNLFQVILNFLKGDSNE